MATFQTFLDTEFIDKLTQAKPERVSLVRDEKQRLWDDIVDFLREETSVVIDERGSDIERVVTKHPLLRYLLDRPEGTQCEFRPGISRQGDTADSNPEANKPWRLHLFQSVDGHPAAISERRRAIYLNYEELEYRWPHLSTQRNLNVRDGDSDYSISCWEDLNQAHVPHITSGIVVSDRYMLTSKNSRRNVLDLLSTLVVGNEGSQPNVVPVRILLIADKAQVRPDAESCYRELKEGLRERLQEPPPGVDFKLSLVATNLKHYHDRHIFTNYAFLTSGDSFDYFDYQGEQATAIRKNTVLQVHPKLKKKTLALAAQKLALLHDIVERAKSDAHSVIVGDPGHALLRAAVIR